MKLDLAFPGDLVHVQRASSDTVDVTIETGFWLWKRQETVRLRRSDRSGFWFWASNGVQLTLAPQYVWRSLERALES